MKRILVTGQSTYRKKTYLNIIYVATKTFKKRGKNQVFHLLLGTYKSVQIKIDFEVFKSGDHLKKKGAKTGQT